MFQHLQTSGDDFGKEKLFPAFQGVLKWTISMFCVFFSRFAVKLDKENPLGGYAHKQNLWIQAILKLNRQQPKNAK